MRFRAPGVGFRVESISRLREASIQGLRGGDCWFRVWSRQGLACASVGHFSWDLSFVEAASKFLVWLSSVEAGTLEPKPQKLNFLTVATLKP